MLQEQLLPRVPCNFRQHAQFPPGHTQMLCCAALCCACRERVLPLLVAGVLPAAGALGTYLSSVLCAADSLGNLWVVESLQDIHLSVAFACELHQGLGLQVLGRRRPCMIEECCMSGALVECFAWLHGCMASGCFQVEVGLQCITCCVRFITLHWTHEGFYVCFSLSTPPLGDVHGMPP